VAAGGHPRTVFEGSYAIGEPGTDRIIPAVTGSAYVTAECTLIFDPDDPFRLESGMSASASQSFDVVIAGGGIVGAACALACAQPGCA